MERYEAPKHSGFVAWFLLEAGGMRKSLTTGFCWASTSLVVLLSAPAMGIQRATPQSIRVTSGATHHHSTGRSWGRFFAFASPIDQTGSGRTGSSQAYVFSVVDYACQKGRPELQLPSEEPVTCPNPPKPYILRATDGSVADQIDNPSVNNTGTIVAFEALGSFQAQCASRPGAANRRQVFIKNLATGAVTAVTCEPDGDSYAPSLNDAGGALTFVSTARLTGSTSGTPQVYVYQYQSPDPLKVGQLTAISYGAFALGAAPSGAPMLNKLGTHVVFESRADLLGTGADSGVWNIFWFDRQVEQLYQVTHGNGDSRNPFVEEKRPGSVFFDSVATDLGGAPTQFTGRQIYRAEILDTGDVPFIEQWTFGVGDSWMPAVEPNGGKVLFLSGADLLLNGTTGARLFSIDFRDPAVNVLYQITGRGSIQGRIGASLGSWFASFDSDDDVGGYGVCGRQVWIVTYDPTHYADAGHARLAATQLGQVPGEPFPGDANLGCADGNPCSTDACVGGQICTHGQRPEGTVCGDGNQCTDGVGVCQQGECTQQQPLDCDDENFCTNDTCDAQSGCVHTAVVCDDGDPCTADACEAAAGCTSEPLPSMEDLACQNGQVQGKTPPDAGKQVLRTLKRAERFVLQARNLGPRGAQRKLKQAQRMFGIALDRIADDPDISTPEARSLISQINELLDRIGEVLAELKQQIAGGSK
ncbi:MAG: hypothetical protein ACREQL_09490 [Candidatus Binatia bacterium]